MLKEVAVLSDRVFKVFKSEGECNNFLKSNIYAIVVDIRDIHKNDEIDFIAEMAMRYQSVYSYATRESNEYETIKRIINRWFCYDYKDYVIDISEEDWWYNN